ncbi:N-acetylgalactosamine-N,N'-diacetylbacillosaminyl-diphospho-undecaprenol 4-alpha-N-acetylgalactosaminyltransferase [Mixta theicola]|nr:glycosyltransferase [Mixta theicola]QHM74989.1 N-acetylgalactosamine-N,N'-diacetylbacillosaminyl-diphospho-undecaprenol 4-alpha-N-acetylgalactosaminyltransferase [Mixta theicola]
MENKIILFIDSFKKGGAETVCATYLNILLRENFDAVIWAYSWGDASVKKELNDKVQSVIFDKKNGLRSFPSILKHMSRLESGDIILAFNHQIALLLLMARFLTRKKIKIVARNVNYLSKNLNDSTTLKTKIVSFLVKYLYQKCDYFVAQCYKMKKDMIDNFQIKSEKIKVIYNPVSEKIVLACDKLKKTNNLPSKDIDFLFVGRLEKQKGIVSLAKIISEIQTKLAGVNITVVGDGSLAYELTNLNINHVSSTDNIVEFYQRAKVLILTSEYEGFPNVLVEGLYCGVPVISFDCPSGPSELIDNGINGYLIEPGNIDKFVNYAIHLLKCPKHGYLKENILHSDEELTDFMRVVINEI